MNSYLNLSTHLDFSFVIYESEQIHELQSHSNIYYTKLSNDSSVI